MPEQLEIELSAMRAAHRDSYPMGNARHGTPDRPDWGAFCVECIQSWPCDVSLLLNHIDRLAAGDVEAPTPGEGLTRNAPDGAGAETNHTVYRPGSPGRAD